MIRQETVRRFVDLCGRFAGKRVLVLGDVMIDQFIWGDVERISPEAPVPVVRVQSESFRLGGAANVAANLRALGARAYLAGVMGDDAGAGVVADLVRSQGIDGSAILSVPKRPTTLKTRIIAHGQQVVRLDREHADALDADTRRALLARLQTLVPDLDGIVIADYAKGVIDAPMMTGLRRALGKRSVPVAVDPQVKNTPLYRGLTIITPNHHEAGAAAGRKLVTEEDVLWAGRTLLKKLRLRAVLITRGEKGMALFEQGGGVTLIPTVAREVYDVTGAGDTVIATLALALAAGASMPDAAAISNFAAGVVVGEVGTATIAATRLVAEIQGARRDARRG
jgi:D-beta-D-heptose 7-phosphate kinase/D-beta-D-heptose 1-phosphate adenosyltransferase